MLTKKKNLKIIAEKQEIFAAIPEDILSREKIEEIRRIPSVAVGDIRNSDHVSAVLKVLRHKKPDAFVPVLTYSGAEYGDWRGFEKYLKQVKAALEKRFKVYVPALLLAGAPDFFRSLNTACSEGVKRRFGVYSPCLGCRLYSLAVKVPLCRQLNAKIMVSGDVVQIDAEKTPACFYEDLRACSLLMKGFGLELWESAVSEPAADRILAEMGLKNKYDDSGGLRCVMQSSCSSGYRLNGSRQKIRKYYEDFAIPAAAKILSRVFAGGVPDYSKEVDEALMIRGK